MGEEVVEKVIENGNDVVAKVDKVDKVVVEELKIEVVHKVVEKVENVNQDIQKVDDVVAKVDKVEDKSEPAVDKVEEVFPNEDAPKFEGTDLLL